MTKELRGTHDLDKVGHRGLLIGQYVDRAC